MDFTNELSDAATLREMGERLARYRLNRNLTQAALAKEAGVSPRTLHRLEHGESVNGQHLLRVLRVLGLLENLEALVPDPAVSPLQQARRQGKVRKRASSPRKTESPDRPWTWGDEE